MAFSLHFSSYLETCFKFLVVGMVGCSCTLFNNFGPQVKSEFHNIHRMNSQPVFLLCTQAWGWKLDLKCFLTFAVAFAVASPHRCLLVSKRLKWSLEGSAPLCFLFFSSSSSSLNSFSTCFSLYPCCPFGSCFSTVF